MKNLKMKELDEAFENLKEAREELLEAEKILLMVGEEEAAPNEKVPYPAD